MEKIVISFNGKTGYKDVSYKRIHSNRADVVEKALLRFLKSLPHDLTVHELSKGLSIEERVEA